jgi:DUF1680 family protein
MASLYSSDEMVHLQATPHTGNSDSRFLRLTASAFLAVSSPSLADPPRIEPVPFTAVKLTDRFWAPRIEANRRVTIPACFTQCEETGRIANFDRAAARLAGKETTPFQGNCYDDSDVYKVIEGAAYSLAQHPDPALDAYLDDLIRRIAAAQEPDGYLYTIATANGRAKDARWKDERWSHETYCAGHLFEAAVAHYQATGKEHLLDVSRKLADLLVAEFLHGDRKEVPGHQEVEIGLVRLARVTGVKEYVDLARRFLLQRGVAEGRELYGDYCQDHQPLVDQREAVGHAVRAGYLYSGMADVAAYTGEKTFDAALDAIWKDCVGTKLAVTGSIGAFAHNEGFGKPYDLPNESAYNETCAAIANSLWNHRMFLRSGSSDPIDVLERTIYNGVASGVSLAGDRFFYPNPLASDGQRPFNHGTLGRAPWFGCACCPVNVARFVPSVPGFLYATQGDTLFVNLYVQSNAEIPLDGRIVRVTQSTDMPWSSDVELAVDLDEPRPFTLAVRIPSWMSPDLVRGGPYQWRQGPVIAPAIWTIAVNGEPISRLPLVDGYRRIERTWKAGDRVSLGFPMGPKRIAANDAIESTRGRMAIGMGPIVYCVEATDNGGADATLRDVYLPHDAPLEATPRADLLGGVTTVTTTAKRAGGGEIALTAVPYATWANRPFATGVGEMVVWLPASEAAAERVPPATLATAATPSASHTWVSDTPRALNDRRLPKSSSDTSIPRHTWWDRKGTTEWVQYEWPAPQVIRSAAVTFFDDTGVGGGCALPKSWRLLRREGDTWTPIAATYDVARDRACVAAFAPITTDALRLEVALEPGRSGGILEWTVE